jgi:hypothetical protein
MKWERDNTLEIYVGVTKEIIVLPPQATWFLEADIVFQSIRKVRLGSSEKYIPVDSHPSTFTYDNYRMRFEFKGSKFILRPGAAQPETVLELVTCWPSKKCVLSLEKSDLEEAEKICAYYV